MSLERIFITIVVPALLLNLKKYNNTAAAAEEEQLSASYRMPKKTTFLPSFKSTISPQLNLQSKDFKNTLIAKARPFKLMSFGKTR